MYLNLPRIYYQNQILQDNVLTIEGELHHYLINVMRIKTNGLFRIFNGKDGEFLAKVTDISKKNCHILVKNLLAISAIPNYQITLLFSPIKHHRLQILIEKATELGVSAFQPILMQHSVVRDFNVEKYTQIASQAVEQSGRFKVPVFNDIIKFNDFIKLYQDQQIMWACERLANHTEVSKLAKMSNYQLLIGPEGGFSDSEKEILKNMANITPISLGDYVLRAETAAISFCSWVNYINSNYA